MKLLKIILITVIAGFAGFKTGIWLDQPRSQEINHTQSRAQKVINLPDRAPQPGIKDIQLAMQKFKIQKPSNVKPPVYDPDSPDRGTLFYAYEDTDIRRVTIGPFAFSSWAILGSTLGHEIEVHGNQDLERAQLEDLFSSISYKLFKHHMLPDTASRADHARERFAGTWRVEREAYLYEINNADRFGLSDAEVRGIRNTLKQFFPK